MSQDATAMLFAPPLPPIQLPTHEPVFLGRGRDCQVRLSDPDTSRRHARLAFEGDHYVVEDLKSTNGTFVNGERIERHDLQPGDRLQIGANQITFCQVEGSVDIQGDADDANTVLFERPVTGDDAFRGDLAQIPPFAVVQILELGRKTGLLRIDSDHEPGELWLDAGNPIHAETKHQVGFDAALSLISASDGRFVFEPRIELPDATIQASVTQLLLEASRQLDEQEI